MVKGEQLRTALNRWYHLINTGNGEKAKSLKRKLEAFGNIQDPDLSCFYRLLTAWYFLMQHDYDQSSAILNTISPHREKSHWLNYYYYFFRGVNAFYFRNYNEALQFLQEAKPFLRDKPEIEQAEFYYRIASVYFRTHHFSLSIKFATKSLRAFSNKDQSERMADCENLLGLNYMSLEDYDRSMIHLKTALNLCRAAKSDNLLKWVIYQNLGLLYAHKGEYDRARTFYEEVYRCIDTKYEWIQLQNIHELCETYFLLNEADKGKALLAEGLRKANDPSNDYFHRFKVLEAKFAARDHAHETYQKAIAHFSQHERWQLVMELSKELIYFQDHNAFPFENRTAADSESRSDEAVCLGYGIYFDPKAHWVGRPDRPNALSKHEIQLMRLFVKHRGEPLQTAEIAERIWHGAIENNSVRKAIHRLKKKLGPASELLSGRPQGGYVLQKDNTPVP